jgi:hypothetical protein
MTARLLIICLTFWNIFPIMAQTDSTISLQRSLFNETMLHPGDAFTGYVYKKGEWGYNQAITPYPSWAWWGITDRITTELDIECWLGGVPSFNFRFGLLKQKSFLPSIAFETMFQYLKNERDQFDNLDYLDVKRQGTNWYNHINMSWKINNNCYLHLAGGATYAEFISISNDDTVNYRGKSFNNIVSPDFSIGIDYRIKKWITLHSTASYGSTFLYADNIVRKQQITIATRIAPFINSNLGFLNSFRIEFALLHANFNDAKESISGPIGFLYWQWDWSKNRKQSSKNK